MFNLNWVVNLVKKILVQCLKILENNKNKFNFKDNKIQFSQYMYLKKSITKIKIQILNMVDKQIPNNLRKTMCPLRHLLIKTVIWVIILDAINPLNGRESLDLKENFYQSNLNRKDQVN